jgi:CheY-like chemotaxis protein
MQKILVAGQDARLLATRAEVLKKTGADVVSCTASEALKLLESETVDLVVLCHSLSEEEVERIAHKAHERGQRTRVLVVVPEVSRERLHRDATFDATTLSDPTRLIARATELLQGLPNHHLKEIVNGQQRRTGL